MHEFTIPLLSQVWDVDKHRDLRRSFFQSPGVYNTAKALRSSQGTYLISETLEGA